MPFYHSSLLFSSPLLLVIPSVTRRSSSQQRQKLYFTFSLLLLGTIGHDPVDTCVSSVGVATYISYWYIHSFVHTYIHPSIRAAQYISCRRRFFPFSFDTLTSDGRRRKRSTHIERKIENCTVNQPHSQALRLDSKFTAHPPIQPNPPTNRRHHKGKKKSVWVWEKLENPSTHPHS